MSRKDLVLLVLLTLCWGMNWPVMKMGVNAYPPIAFRVFGMIGAIPVLWLAARLQGEPLSVSPKQLRVISILSLPNMLVWQVLLVLGLKALTSSGRAAILCYTMPVWAVLFGLLLFRDRLSRLAWVGIACAMLGAVLLLSSEVSALSGQPLGSILVLLSAAVWGVGTVYMKRTDFGVSTIAITFWMLVLSSAVMLAMSVMMEISQWRMPNNTEWAAIAYNAILVFGFAYGIWFRLARNLPPVASSLSVMMIPVVGVFSGAWILGETPQWQDYVAMVLILVAMGTILFKKEPEPEESANRDWVD